MTTPKNDGGAAFPMPAYLDGPDGRGTQLIVMESSGLTLRDWFAGTIKLTAFDELLIELFRKDSHSVEETITYIAKLRGRHADAMLAEREKERQ